MHKIGRTWVFDNGPKIIATGTSVGPFEGSGALGKEFDLVNSDLRIGQDSFEKAERTLLEQASQLALNKANLKNNEIDYFISGDLLNQIITSSFAARTMGAPFIGIYGACSSSMEALAIAAYLVDTFGANYVIAAGTSHNSAAEKQYRYPNEYGSQKPPTAQWTVTGSGVAIVAKNTNGIKITSATIGKVVDFGSTDPFDMGTAMAPAAIDTLKAHLQDNNIAADYYDLIVTGDLGAVGHKIASEILIAEKIITDVSKFKDCGLMIYSSDQEVFSGGSGCGCTAVVTYSTLLKQLSEGVLNKILIIATGALLSPVTYQQRETIPSIAHAVALER